jgi:hypothetical protein
MGSVIKVCTYQDGLKNMEKAGKITKDGYKRLLGKLSKAAVSEN